MEEILPTTEHLSMAKDIFDGHKLYNTTGSHG